MLIFEGPDGSGKTTLIKQFQEAFDIPVAPRVVTNKAEAMVNLQEWVDTNLDQGFQYMMYDRHRLISEPIYGSILRSKQEPGFTEMKWLAPRLRRFYHLKPILVYCLPPLQTVFNNVDTDLDNMVVRDRISSIYSAYVAKAAMDYSFSPTSIYIWDYTRSPTIKDRPWWFNSIYSEIKERTDAAQ